MQLEKRGNALAVHSHLNSKSKAKRMREFDRKHISSHDHQTPLVSFSTSPPFTPPPSLIEKTANNNTTTESIVIVPKSAGRVGGWKGVLSRSKSMPSIQLILESSERSRVHTDPIHPLTDEQVELYKHYLYNKKRFGGSGPRRLFVTNPDTAATSNNENSDDDDDDEEVEYVTNRVIRKMLEKDVPQSGLILPPLPKPRLVARSLVDASRAAGHTSSTKETVHRVVVQLPSKSSPTPFHLVEHHQPRQQKKQQYHHHHQNRFKEQEYTAPKTIILRKQSLQQPQPHPQKNNSTPTPPTRRKYSLPSVKPPSVIRSEHFDEGGAPTLVSIKEYKAGGFGGKTHTYSHNKRIVKDEDLDQLIESLQHSLNVYKSFGGCPPLNHQCQYNIFAEKRDFDLLVKRFFPIIDDERYTTSHREYSLLLNSLEVASAKEFLFVNCLSMFVFQEMADGTLVNKDEIERMQYYLMQTTVI